MDLKKAFEDADGTLHILDVVTNQGRGPDIILVIGANPERTRNVFFVTRTDGVLRRTAASYEKNPAIPVPNTVHPDCFAHEIEYRQERLPRQ